MIIAVAIQWVQRILTLTSSLFHPNEGGRFQQVGGTVAYSSTSPGKFHHTFHPVSGDPSVQKAKLECGDGLAINLVVASIISVSDAATSECFARGQVGALSM